MNARRKPDLFTNPNLETGQEPAAHIPPPPSSAKRDRGWEASQRAGAYCQVSYRKMPVDIRNAISEIATEHYVRVDDVARLFLAFALERYQRGEIQIEPILQKGKLTLFPEK